MALGPEHAEMSSKWSSRDPWSEVKHAPGAYPPSPNPPAQHAMAEQFSVAAAVKARRAEYTTKKIVTIKVGTWNTAAMSGTDKDLAGWFISGLGVKGLSQNLSQVSLNDTDEHDDDGDYTSSDDNIESVEEQEKRASKKKGTLPMNDVPAVDGDDNVGIYVLGLQEVVDIASVTEALRPYYDPNSGKKWKRAMKKALPLGYKKMAEVQLLGLLILVYAAPDVAPAITSVDTQSVGTGALGYMGNKGAVSVRIVLGGLTRMVFVNCHLAAGADDTALQRRIWDTKQILDRTKYLPANHDGDILEGVQEVIGDEDFAFWFGDLNYRLDGVPGEDVRRLLLLHTRNEYDVLNKSRRRIDSELGYVEPPPRDSLSIPEHYEYSDIEGTADTSNAEPPLDPQNDPASLITTIKSLLVHDQLRAQQRLGKAFHEGWREGDINFLPTYKYDVGSVGMFDSGEKRRSPSWCDRILFRTRRDKEAYEARVLREADAHKRDEEMKARGIDADAADQEVLFDYNPDNDGADDYDEYDDADDAADDVQSVKTVEGAEDVIKLEDYVSHQRVLSSDHKPLSAVFTLTYDAVVPELKNKIHQEVTREFDKSENEARPSLTLVVEILPDERAHADEPTGASELSAVKFDSVRYKIPQTRSVTLANTSLIAATFAFIERTTQDGRSGGPAPSWLSVHVNCESQPSIPNDPDFGASTQFTLQPGDVTTVDLTVNVFDGGLVGSLNNETIALDDILVLRIRNGRDHFLRVQGSWLATSYHCTLDELVRVEAGIRNARHPRKLESSNELAKTSSLYHSAPRELFALTEAIPIVLERAVADWTMVNAGEEAPWKVDFAWPFTGTQVDDKNMGLKFERLAAVREALDTATPIDDHLDPTIPPLERTELLAEILTTFLESLQDGVVPASVWAVIEQRFQECEKSKLILETGDVHEMTMDVLSSYPVHSVSFTFVTFMLTRIITELSIEPPDAAKSPTSPETPLAQLGRHSRSSTQVSDSFSTLSDDSSDLVTKIPAGRSRLSSLLSSMPAMPSLPSIPSIPGRKRAALISPSSTLSPTSPQVPIDRRRAYVTAYVKRLAPVLFRSNHDLTVKGKEKKTLDARKKRVLEAFLGIGLL